jgi:hypothetical protein
MRRTNERRHQLERQQRVAERDRAVIGRASAVANNISAPGASSPSDSPNNNVFTNNAGSSDQEQNSQD